MSPTTPAELPIAPFLQLFVKLRGKTVYQVPEEQSLDYWNITPKRVAAYRKSAAWREVLKGGAEKAAKKMEQQAMKKSAKESGKKIGRHARY